MRVLAPLHGPPASGNDTTIRRIAAHLTALGHSVLLAPAPEDPFELAKMAKERDVDGLIGTHLYLSGRLFLESDLPYVVVLGGTDLNEFALEPEYLAVMTEVVERGHAIVAFNDDFVDRYAALWPETANRLFRIPQAARTEPSRFCLRTHLGLARDSILFLLPAGLRPVKDPLYVVDRVQRWHCVDSRVHLVITGLTYESGYLDIVSRRCGNGQGVYCLDALPQADLHAAMLESTAVLNTSLSECSPNAVLEAMHLGVPVLVRDIPGNTCIVTDSVTGLVFDSVDRFQEQARRLIDDPTFARRIGARAQEYVRREHRLDDEQAAYAKVFEGMRVEQMPTAPAMRDRPLRVNGVELSVETFGDPTDVAVLLIAGSGASMLTWETEFCERLAANGKFVIRYDHRDTGRSANCAPGVPEYTMDDLVADAVGVLDGLGVVAADLVGASMGAMIAQRIALDEPARVRTLTLLSASPAIAGADDPDLPGASLRFRVELDDLDLPDWSDRAAVVEYLVAVDRLLAGTARPFDDRSPRERAGLVFDRAGGRLASAANHQLIDPGAPWRGRLESIAVPTLVVHGAADPMFPLTHGKVLAEAIPNAELLVLDAAGHGFTAADMETVLTTLLRHVS